MKRSSQTPLKKETQILPPLAVKPYLTEIAQLIQELYLKMTEDEPKKASLESILLNKIDQFLKFCAYPNHDTAKIQPMLLSINLSLRAMNHLFPNTNAPLKPPVASTRFARNPDQQSHPLPTIGLLYQKLQGMIQFYCVKTSSEQGISRSLGTSYSTLFNIEPLHILSSKDTTIFKLIETYAPDLNVKDIFSVEKNNKIQYYLSMSKIQKERLMPYMFAAAKESLSWQEEALSHSDEKLFFELSVKGFQIYCAHNKSIEILKSYLQDFGFEHLEYACEATAPKVAGFENHTQYLTISHLQAPKLIALYFKTERPQTYLNDLYSLKKLDRRKCCFFSERSQAFKEADADFYRACFEQFLLKKTPKTAAFLACLVEDQNFSKLDPRRYLGALLTLENNFYSLKNEEIEKFPPDLLNALIGLKSQLIFAENDESAGVSRRLSRHFHQVYEMRDFNAKAPFVLFTKEGCCFYFDSETAFKILAEQFEVHHLVDYLGVKISQDTRRGANEPDAKEYPFKLVVPAHYNHALVALGRIHPANIEIALKQAYERQDLDFKTLFLQSQASRQAPQKEPHHAQPKALCAYNVVSLKNGDLIVQMKVQTLQMQETKSMGHVIFVIDNSSSMAGGRIRAATLACVNLIDELPPNTHITLRTFDATLLNCLKMNLPSNWSDIILKIKANYPITPLVQTLTNVAENLSPDRCFVPAKEIENVTVIFVTDGEGQDQETSQEIIHAIRTGTFRGTLVPGCQHGLGTKQLPNYTPLIIIPIGIGLQYNQDIGELGLFGFYHIREDETNMEADLQKMIKSVKPLLGPKVGPIYAGLFNADKSSLITTKIDYMLPQASHYSYIRMPFVPHEKLSNLTSIISIDSHCNIMNLTPSKTDKPIIEAYFRSQITNLFKAFLIKVTVFPTYDQPTFRRGNNEALLMFSPKENINPFEIIQKNLSELTQEIQENNIYPLVQAEIQKFETLINDAKTGKLTPDTFRALRARVTRDETLLEDEEKSANNNKMSKVVFN